MAGFAPLRARYCAACVPGIAPLICGAERGCFRHCAMEFAGAARYIDGQ